MRVVCIYKNLSEAQRVSRRNLTFSKYYYSCELSVGDESNVYAILYSKKEMYYLIWPSGITYVDFMPAVLYEVIDDRPSKNWIEKKITRRNNSILDSLLGMFKEPRCETLVGFPELVDDETLFYKYIEDYPDAIEVVNKNIKLIDEEYKIIASLKHED